MGSTMLEYKSLCDRQLSFFNLCCTISIFCGGRVRIENPSMRHLVIHTFLCIDKTHFDFVLQPSTAEILALLQMDLELETISHAML